MAINPLKPVVNNIFLTTSFVDIYTVSQTVNRFGIDAACFNNTSSSNVTYTVRIVQSGSGDLEDELITEKTIRAKDNDLATGIIGQSLVAGGIIQAKASVNGVVSVSITGTEIT